MPLKDVDQFLGEYSADATMRMNWQDKAKRPGILAKYTGLSPQEHAMLLRGDAHEVKDYMKDTYGAALSVQFT